MLKGVEGNVGYFKKEESKAIWGGECMDAMNALALREYVYPE